VLKHLPINAAYDTKLGFTNGQLLLGCATGLTALDAQGGELWSFRNTQYCQFTRYTSIGKRGFLCLDSLSKRRQPILRLPSRLPQPLRGRSMQPVQIARAHFFDHNGVHTGQQDFEGSDSDVIGVLNDDRVLIRSGKEEIRAYRR
jgi:hypothetical protein